MVMMPAGLVASDERRRTWRPFFDGMAAAAARPVRGAAVGAVTASGERRHRDSVTDRGGVQAPSSKTRASCKATKVSCT